MKCVIVEDEALAAERLVRQIEEIAPEMEVAAVVGSVADAVRWFTMNSTDLAFFDIQLSDGLSFDVFSRCEVDCPVIFTTAYNEFAIRAFKHNSIDYLLKPVGNDELAAALRKFRKMNRPSLPDLASLRQSLGLVVPEYPSRFLIQYGEKLKSVPVEEVARFQAVDKAVFLITRSGQSMAVDFTLDKLEGMLRPSDFFRINRKLIIAFGSIRSMTAYSRGRVLIVLNPPLPSDEQAVVSIERAPDFRRWLGDHR